MCDKNKSYLQIKSELIERLNNFYKGGFIEFSDYVGIWGLINDLEIVVRDKSIVEAMDLYEKFRRITNE